MPLWAVPSQYASTSSLVMPAPANASLDASSARSSTPVSQCSLNGVQPIPTMATRSLIPWLAMSGLRLLVGLGGGRRGAHGPTLPEVVVDAVAGEQPAERHLHPVADGDVGGVDIGELD